MKAERQYLAHFIDAAFDTTYAASTYVRLGDDLEEFNEELNPEVETKKNILVVTMEPRIPWSFYFGKKGLMKRGMQQKNIIILVVKKENKKLIASTLMI